jgi:hypothetical protein
MRGLMLMTTLAGVAGLAACGSEPAPEAPREEPPIVLRGGQWTLARTQTGYNTPTVTQQEYAAHVGGKSEDKLCLKVDDKGLPDADALAGEEGKDCTYADQRIRKGRFIATLSCKAGNGTSELLLEGNYTPDSMTLAVSMTKTVDGKPALRTTHDLTGTRTGDCAADDGKA